MDEFDKILNQIALTNPNELYVVNEFGTVYKLECPFEVTAIEDVGHLSKDEVCNVVSVHINKQIESVYKINDAYYLYSSFEIN